MSWWYTLYGTVKREQSVPSSDSDTQIAAYHVTSPARPGQHVQYSSYYIWQHVKRSQTRAYRGPPPCFSSKPSSSSPASPARARRHGRPRPWHVHRPPAPPGNTIQKRASERPPLAGDRAFLFSSRVRGPGSRRSLGGLGRRERGVSSGAQGPRSCRFVAATCVLVLAGRSTDLIFM